MTDYLAPTSPQSEFDTGSDFDVTNVDSNFRAISAVENKWRLPKLPDEVKLDLSTMPQVDQQSLTDFLLGIDHDLLDVEEEVPVDQPAPDFMPDRSATDLFRIYAAGVTQSRHPEEVTVDAVKRFKYDAIRKGYLGADTQLDSSWSPELNSIRREMLFDDYNDRIAGNRPGAVPTNTILEQLGKWTSPSGLLAAATELDLWWDFGAIKNEWSSWGDKWRKVSESTNPIDLGKNLIDAVTGPIDDIVFPAANLLLLGTGMGALANTGRIALLGARAAEGGLLMRGLYSATGLVLPSSMSAITEASWTARRFMTHEGVLGAIGRGLAAWREIPTVARTKQALQVGMRAGFMAQAEDLVPGYQGGRSLSQIDPIGEGAQHLRDFGLHSILSTPLELALTPYNIFREGTFMGPNGIVRRLGSGLLVAGGSIPGRAVLGGTAGAAAGVVAGDDTGDVLEGATYGALASALLPQAAGLIHRAPGVVRGAVAGTVVGAGVAAVTDVDPEDAIAFGAVTGATMVPLSSAWSTLPNPGKWVGWATDVLSRMSYKPIANDQRVSLAFQKGIRRALAENPEALQRWDDSFRSNNSLTKTLADFLGTDEEGAAAAVSYVTLAAAIDHTASAQAGGRMGDQFHLFRNKLVSQLRTFDLEDFTLEEVARAAAIDRTTSVDYRKAYERILSKLTPESARDFAEAHNEVARQTMAQLMSFENMPDLNQYVRLGPWTQLDEADRLGVIEAYLPEAMPTFGNWPLFTRQSHQVQGWVNDGTLDNAEFLPVLSPFTDAAGNRVTRQVKAEVFKVDPRITEADDAAMDALLGDAKVRQRTRGKLAPLARMQPSGRFTLARKDTVTKQQLEQTALELEDLVHASEHLRYLTQRGVMKQVKDLGQLSEIPREELSTFLRVNSLGANFDKLRYLHSFMKRHGVSDPELAAMIDQQIASLVDDVETWSKLGLSPMVRDANQVPMTGIESLKARVREIRKRARYTAAEIDEDSVLRSITDEVAKADMAEQFAAMRRDGYKLVHGVEYMMPHDLAVNTGLFKDIGVREMNAATMGNFFARRPPAVARMQQERRERAMIVKALADADLGDFDPHDDRITQAYRDLRAILNEQQDNLAQRLEERQLMGFMARKRLALESTFAPLRVEDLVTHRPLVIDRLTSMGWTDKQADAIFSSIRHFRDTEFKNLGIYAFEAKMRERNELVSFLKFLGGSNYSNGLISSTRLGMVGGAFAGQDYATSQLPEDASEDQVLGARLVGLVGGAALGGAAAGGLGSLVRRNGWIDDAIRRAEQRPGAMIADKLVRLRDALRFGLSPIFDLSRYTEGLMLSHVGVPLRHPTTGARISLPVDMSPTGVKRRLGQSTFQRLRSEYRQLGRSGGVGDIDVLDDAGHWFSQIGIMGFSPQDWQVGAYAELRHVGVPMKDAFEAARTTHTYGTRGRSPAELSINFVFFPFSFQKKAFTHVAKWMNDDLGRSIMIHDGIAAYQALDEKYNLDEYWHDHIPALDMLRRFNLLAYGASPGRFGGINSQVFESLGRAAILFTPVGGNIQNEQDFMEVQKLYRSLMPAINDINWMVEEMKGTDGLFSQTHQLRRGQIEDGYRDWNEYRKDLQRQLDEQGYTWSDLHHKPYLSDTKIAYEAKRAELGQKYPGWKDARRNSIFNMQAIEMEKDDQLAAAMADPENASDEALMLAAFEQQIAEVKRVLGYQGVTVDGSDGWTDAPPWAFEYLIERAVQMLQQNPRFKSVYKKFYERELGPIEAKL